MSIRRLLAENNLNEAENLLFEMLDATDYDYLLIALFLYSKINEMNDDDLEKADFSRDEIEAGLTEIKRIYGIFF